MTQEHKIGVIDLESSTLILTLQNSEDIPSILVSTDGKWILKPEDETRQTWSVSFSDYGLNIKLYQGATLDVALILAQNASGAKDVTVRDFASLSS